MSQIRVKSVQHADGKAIAVYFYDFTHHMKTISLEREVIEEKERNQNLRRSQVTVSHEFRTPLSSSLMLLESLRDNNEVPESVKQTIWVIITNINFLLCVVNDLMDL